MEIRENNHETSTPLVDSSLFDFIDTMEPSLFDFLDTLSPPVKPFTHAINHQPVFTLSPLSTCVHPSPQPSYPSRPGLSTDREIVDDDTPDPTTPPDNQEWSGMIADLMRSPQHISEHAGEGILEGVAMSFYRSMFSDSDAPCPESGYVENEVINPNKKPRLEQPDSFCKRCKCQKSKCLMLYCGCFAAGVYCMEPCACINCLNKPSHKDMVLAAGKQIEARKPLAFAPKVTTCWDSLPDFRTIPRHRCICKKGCQMKYCGCFQGGVGCSFYCKCEGSKNPFPTKENCSGQKLSMDHQLEKGDKRRQLERSFQKTTITATTSGTCHLNKALEGGDSINDGKSDSVPSAAASNGAPPISATTTAELDQSFGDSLVSNVASPGSSTTTYDNNLHGSSLFVNASKPLVSPAFPVFGQQMASSAFGFSSQPHPFMSAFGHQAAPAVRQFPFHLSSQIQF